MRPWTNAAIFEILIEGKNSFLIEVFLGVAVLTAKGP